MKSAEHIFLIAILMFVVNSGCQPSRERRLLSHAEAVMEEHPDSAYKMLESIDTGALSSAGDKALYYLLMTQAMVKNDIPITSDSLIRIAVDYFSDAPVSGNYMKSLYCMAYHEFIREDLISAIYPATKAYDIACTLGDYFWKAKTADMLGDIFSDSYNVCETERFGTESAVFCSLAGKERHHRFALCNLAIARGNAGKRESAIATIDSLLGIAKRQPQDSGLIADCLSAKIIFYIALNKPSKAIESLSELKGLGRFYEWRPDDESYLLLAREMARDSTISPHPLLIENASSMQLSGQASYYYAKSLYFRESGRYEDALSYTDSFSFIQNDLLVKLTQESTLSPQRNYYNEKSIADRRWSKALTLVTLVIAILSAIIISGGMVIYRLIAKDKRACETRLMCNIEELRETIESGNREREELRASISENEKKHSSAKVEWDTERGTMQRKMRELVKSQWATFNSLCDEYFEKIDSEKQRKEIASSIYKEIKRFRSRQNMRYIEDMVNIYLENAASRLREQCGFLSEEDVRFITLVFAGLPARSVCVVLDMGYKNFYQKRSRLRARIAVSEAPDKDLFIAYLS